MCHDSLTIGVRPEPGYVLVTAAGEIDIFTVARLREALFTLAGEGRPLIADLDRVTFLGAAGLGALAGAARRAAARRLQPARGLRPAADPPAAPADRPGPHPAARPHPDRSGPSPASRPGPSRPGPSRPGEPSSTLASRSLDVIGILVSPASRARSASQVTGEEDGIHLNGPRCVARIKLRAGQGAAG